ncbi:MAG TPA: thiol reductase thioredoxin, partial [Vicinamibacteria bacterium]|nr:thiol reductase thioredoxin [Vicinamibacteria bacterium]
MRASVYTDRALEGQAGRFVWLSIDTEDAANDAFLTRYPVSVWPTLLVVEPRTGAIALRYAGGATVPQLLKLLDDGERAARGQGDKADAAIARGDGLANQGDAAAAAAAYEEAIAAAGPRWPRLGRAAEALTFALSQARQHERCARRALELFPRVAGTYSAANVALNGVFCARDLPAAHTGRPALLQSLESAARQTLEDPAIPFSADDRSGLFDALVAAREGLKDEPGARAPGPGVQRHEG